MGNDVSTPEEETTSRRCSSVAAAEFLGAPRTTETESDPTEPEASPTGAYASKLAAPYRMVRKTAASAASAGSKAWAAWSAAGTKASEKEEQLRELIRQRIEGRMEPADEIHELCATVNHELDYHEDPATFRAALQAAYGDELQEAELIVQDNLHSRIGFAVSQGVTVVAWRGSKTLVELGTDAGFSPSLCHLWFDLTDQIQAHGAMMAVIEHDFLVFRKRLAARLSALDVGRLVFSGHSLGGGLAQIAHLALLGEQHAGRFSNLVVESVVFASPMVFFVAADTTEATQSVLQELFRSSVNYILHNDATPRMPGLPEFWVPALKEAAKAMVRKGFAEKGSHLQRAVKWKLIFGDGRVDILFDLLERRTQYALDTCRGYRHTCKLLLVPLYDANQGILEMGFEEFASMPYCAECDSDEMLHIEAEFAWIIHVCLPRNFARTYRPFRLKHAASGLCIACTEEGQLQLRNNWGSNHDELFWRRLHVQINVRPPDGTFRLASKASQRWLTVEGSDLQTSDDDVDEQYWTLFLRGDGEYHLESYSSSKLLAVIGPPGQERLGLCSKTQPGEQRWKLIPQKQKPGTHPQSEEN